MEFFVSLDDLFGKHWSSGSSGSCLAFDGGSQFGNKEGFNDWKSAANRISQHKRSATEIVCSKSYEKRNILGRVESALTAQLNDKIMYWRNGSKRATSNCKD